MNHHTIFFLFLGPSLDGSNGCYIMAEAGGILEEGDGGGDNPIDQLACKKILCPEHLDK